MEFGYADIAMILFVTIGPTKAAIVMGTLTQGAEPALRRQIVIRAVLVATIVTLVFVLFGEVLLGIFHVSLAALKLAGGLILTIFALNMVFGDKGHEGAQAVPSLALGTYPLAIPLIATPQGLVAITAIAAGMSTVGQLAVLAAIVLAIMAFNLMFLMLADRIIKLLGVNVLMVVGKIFGVLLAGLAMQLFILGLQDLGLIAKDLVH